MYKRQGSLTVTERTFAKNYHIRLCQKVSFPTAYKLCKQFKSTPPSSILNPLNPKIDEEDIIRCDNRLANVPSMSFERRYPIILPKEHAVTQLVIQHYHERHFHATGTNHLLSELSKEFWILRAREIIKRILSQCRFCRRKKFKPCTQIMAPLLVQRCKGSLQLFSYTSVDFAGPFLTRQTGRRAKEKRYLCLFTCLEVRAVHLEMTYSLETDAFINALQRFIRRRGVPVKIYLDNGRTFVGAERELKEQLKKVNKDTLINHFKSIEWSFLPPYAPHFGGSHEALVKSAKRAVISILESADIYDEELQTAFAQTESLLNSRPLCYQTSNAIDFTPLTPNHFLTGMCCSSLMICERDEHCHPRKRYERIQQLIDHVWRRWSKEWLPSLAPRSKWRKDGINVNVDDVVLVHEPNLKRGEWLLGRVKKVFSGADGKVRVAAIQTKDNLITRSINRLSIVEPADVNES